MNIPNEITYSEAGVDTKKEEVASQELVKWIKKTWTFGDNKGLVKLDIGYFANVIDLGNGLGLAMSADGVGTKILVAQMMDKYDTVGIDCVAMNVNDLLCVGAKPISMLDYIAVQDPNPRLLDEIGKGLYKGAKIANITIPGGEIAQLREMIKGEKEGFGFDLAGMVIGTVATEKIIIGQNIQPGDVVIGIESSGIHSNGLTLARRILFERMNFKVDKYFEELGRTLGEELLEPTSIYVKEISEILNTDIDVKALIHITSDGFLNLLRVASNVGFIIEQIPDPPAIFPLLQKRGNICDEEMFSVFNMGIGFCVVVSEDAVDLVQFILSKHNKRSYKIGYAAPDDEKKLIIKPKRLLGKGNRFYKL